MKKKHVWVAIRTSDGSAAIAEYRGRIDADIFEKITTNKLTYGWVRLDNVVWEKDRLDTRQIDWGKPWGYGDTSYYRIESLTRIILLSEEFVGTHATPHRRG